MRTDQQWRDAVLQLVKHHNSFEYHVKDSDSGNVCLYINEWKVGVLLEEYLQEMCNYPDVFTMVKVKDQIVKVCIDEKLSTVEERSLAMKKVLDDLRQKNKFVALRGWRNETYPIYYKRTEPALMHVERSACSIFGFLMYGVHINGYTYKDGELMMWIGRRSKTKQTYPNMRDNMCAGGLASGLGVRECANKECQEEGSVDEETLTKLKSVGTISYCYHGDRGVFPETQYLFDLEVSPDFVPKNADGEMQNFNLYSIEEIQQFIIDREFKPNCALVIVEFLIRHGLIDADNDLNYPYIIESMHKTLQPAM